MKFYKCASCAKLLTVIDDAPCTPRCCGEAMKELVANTSDGAKEKHVPVFEVADGKVCVRIGEAAHPMLPEHFIDFVALRTKSGCQIKKLHAGEAPEVTFAILPDDEIVAVYEYCNLHGLWKG